MGQAMSSLSSGRAIRLAQKRRASRLRFENAKVPPMPAASSSNRTVARPKALEPSEGAWLVNSADQTVLPPGNWSKVAGSARDVHSFVALRSPVEQIFAGRASNAQYAT
uniref:Uncharacterized protein n=1 Tax=Spumella elongata TaxID=89044 RepID=A0A7S3MFB7_9STRA|mmetsp:Transcript_61627/g.108266  ORF Transcript_61627/g.108266 Transcript_61627/m.108266 type:complete len:109 (+) Transcript_61627:114-440(+)